MGTRGGETRDTERQSLTLLPPPERCVPHRTLSNREGGWALWRPPGNRRQDIREPWRVRELGRPWRIRGLRRPWRIGELGQPLRDRLRDRGPSPRLGLFGRSPPTPPKNFLGENRGSIGHLGAHWRRGLLGALGKRGLLGALGKRGHLGALGRRGHLGALGRRGHLKALGRRGHLRALGRSGLWGVLARIGLWGAHWRALARSRHRLLAALR